MKTLFAFSLTLSLFFTLSSTPAWTATDTVKLNSFKERISLAKKSQNIEQIKKLFYLKTSDDTVIKLMNFNFNSVLDSDINSLVLEALPKDFKAEKVVSGKTYVPTLALSGIAKLTTRQDTAELTGHLPYGELNGEYFFVGYKLKP